MYESPSSGKIQRTQTATGKQSRLKSVHFDTSSGQPVNVIGRTLAMYKFKSTNGSRTPLAFTSTVIAY